MSVAVQLLLDGIVPQILEAYVFLIFAKLPLSAGSLAALRVSAFAFRDSTTVDKRRGKMRHR